MKAKQLITESDRLMKLRDRRGEVPGGFKATRSDGRVWEWRLDPKGNCYRQSVGTAEDMAKNIGLVSFNTVAQAVRAYNGLLARFQQPDIAIEQYRDEPWELTVHGPVHDPNDIR